MIRRAFEALPEVFVFVCRNTSEARAYLQGAGMYADRRLYPFPEAVVSDVRLGDESGVSFLAWMKNIQHLAEMPVIMLTGSASQRELDTAHRLGALRVLRKPGDANELTHILMEVLSEICPGVSR